MQNDIIHHRQWIGAALGAVLVASIVSSAQAQSRAASSVFEATVVAPEVSGIGCGYFVFVGSMRVHVDRVITGPAPSGEVRVLARCLDVVRGRRLRITARPMTPHHGSWGHFTVRHPIPVDSVPTYWAMRVENVSSGSP